MDPTTYSQLDEAVYEFSSELKMSDITIDNLIGSGEFADVFKGMLFKDGKQFHIAVKKLKVL